MKPILFLSIFLSGIFTQTLFADNNKVDNPPHIQLQIKGFKNNYVKLLAFFGDQRYIADSAWTDDNGKAIFQKDTSYQKGMYFILFPDMKYAQMLLDKEQQFSLTFDKENPVTSMVVSNSTDNELLYKNLKFEAETAPKFDSLQRKLDLFAHESADYKKAEADRDKLVEVRKAHIKWFSDNYPNSFFTKFKLMGQNPDIKYPKLSNGSVDIPLQTYYFINDYWKGYDFADERMLHTPVYFNKLKKYIDMLPQSADSLIKYADYVIDCSKANKEIFKFTVNWIAIQYKDPKVMGQESFYVHLIEKYWTYDQAFWAKNYEVDRLRAQVKLMKPSLIGNIGQNVTGTDEFGKTISIYDIKTPFTIVYLFSYDCDNCKKESPKLVEFYNEWKNKGVDVFSICVDGEAGEWKQYLQKNKMTFHNIFDPKNATGFGSKYHVDHTPEIYVLNKNHKIIGSNINSSQIPKIIEDELKKQ
jgi:peroxiredoxin